MKKLCVMTVVLLAWGGANGALLQPTANGPAGKGYFWGGAGPAWTEDADLDEFAGDPVSEGELHFNTGIRFELGGGYHITDWLAAEFETGVIYNSVDSVDAAGLSSGGELDLSQVPMLVNVVFSLPNETGFVPYVGGGVGGAFSVLYADYFALGPNTADGSFSDVVFAWQGFAGLRYDFNENMSLGATYKYFAAESPTWEADTFVGTGLPPYGGYWTTTDTKAGPFRSQSVTLAFTMRF